jgi:hypothetical protein
MSNIVMIGLETDELTELQRMQTNVEAMWEAKKLHDQNCRAFLASLESMNPDAFWVGVDLLAEQIVRTRKTGRYTEHTLYEEAIQEFARKAVCEGVEMFITYCRFAKTYGEMKRALYKPLFDVITGYGDDGYGDLIDSFMFHGRSRYEKALKGEIVGNSDDQYLGENYISMRLEEGAERFFGTELRKLVEHVTPKTEAEAQADHVNRFEDRLKGWGG